VSEGAADILNKRQDGGCCCSLIGRRLMGSEIKFREFFSLERYFAFNLELN
jgi:hypothetical protein